VVETYRESPPVVVGGALVLVGLVAGLVVWRRKRADKRRKR
jgi:LPXTG-motif cell wall-anchored protein